MGKARSLRTILKLKWSREVGTAQVRPGTGYCEEPLTNHDNRYKEPDKRQNKIAMKEDVITTCRLRFLSPFGQFPAECRQAQPS